MKKLISLFCISGIITNSALADVGDKLNKEITGVYKNLGDVWQTLGGESVSNSAAYYQGQQRGYYTMGSMYLAKAKKNRPLVSVNFPEINLDSTCYNQGVLNFGGISFISSSELKNKVENIGKQVGLMHVYLGMSAVSPVLGEALQETYSKLQELGGFLSDECQAAKQIVGFAGDKLSQNSAVAKDIYSRLETSKGGKSDLSKAYRQFPKGKNEALKSMAEKDERYTVQDINIAWKALEKLSISDQELKEMMMTISGTVIIRAPKNDEGLPEYQYISSEVTNTNVLAALLKGEKEMNLLSCGSDKAKCLNVLEKDKFINRADSFEAKVSAYFDKFKEALKEDELLKTEEQQFLAKSGLPVYKIYDVLYQHTNANPEYEQGIVVEFVAWNILYNYLSDILKEVEEGANNLQITASTDLNNFKESIKTAKKMLNDFEMKDLSRYKMQLFLVNRAEVMEDSMSDEISKIIGIAKLS